MDDLVKALERIKRVSTTGYADSVSRGQPLDILANIGAIADMALERANDSASDAVSK